MVTLHHWKAKRIAGATALNHGMLWQLHFSSFRHCYKIPEIGGLQITKMYSLQLTRANTSKNQIVVDVAGESPLSGFINGACILMWEKG
jgi:hypothetical protein